MSTTKKTTPNPFMDLSLWDKADSVHTGERAYTRPSSGSRQQREFDRKVARERRKHGRQIAKMVEMKERAEGGKDHIFTLAYLRVRQQAAANAHDPKLAQEHLKLVHQLPDAASKILSTPPGKPLPDQDVSLEQLIEQQVNDIQGGRTTPKHSPEMATYFTQEAPKLYRLEGQSDEQWVGHVVRALKDREQLDAHTRRQYRRLDRSYTNNYEELVLEAARVHRSQRRRRKGESIGGYAVRRARGRLYQPREFRSAMRAARRRDAATTAGGWARWAFLNHESPVTLRKREAAERAAKASANSPRHETPGEVEARLLRKHGAKTLLEVPPEALEEWNQAVDGVQDQPKSSPSTRPTGVPRAAKPAGSPGRPVPRRGAETSAIGAAIARQKQAGGTYMGQSTTKAYKRTQNGRLQNVSRHTKRVKKRH